MVSHSGSDDGRVEGCYVVIPQDGIEFKPLKIGDHLTLKNGKRDPWGINPPRVVRVLDIKDGWVRYLLDGSDIAMEIANFLTLYA